MSLELGNTLAHLDSAIKAQQTAEASVAIRDAEVVALKAALHDARQERGASALDRDSAIASQNAAVVAQDRLAVEKNAALAEKDKALLEKELANKEMDALRKGQSVLQDELAAVRAEARQLVQDKDVLQNAQREANARDVVLREQHDALRDDAAQLRREVARLRRRNADLHDELAAISRQDAQSLEEQT